MVDRGMEVDPQGRWRVIASEAGLAWFDQMRSAAYGSLLPFQAEQGPIPYERVFDDVKWGSCDLLPHNEDMP